MARTKGARNKPKEAELPSAAKLAQKALTEAISAETAKLNAELAAKDQRIEFLEAQLKQIASQCGVAVGRIWTATERRPISLPSEFRPPDAEPEFPSGPEGELDGADNMGAGRWV